MKNTFTLLLFFLVSFVSAQDITGAWHGALTLPQGQLPLIINITKNGAGYSATMDSPKQGATGIPLTSVTFEKNLLHITMQQANLDYEATYANGGFKGTWKQNGNILALDLTRGEAAKPKRPQEPVKPYPYYSEEVVMAR